MEINNIAETYKQGVSKFLNSEFGASSFTFFNGKITDVIFSCPHAVSQTRDGKIKVADIKTGPLGYVLNKLGYSVLIKTKNCNDDANYDKKSQYKDFLCKYVKTNKVKFVIDLHGMSAKRNLLISLGTAFGKNTENTHEITSEFIKIANECNINCDKIRIDFPFNALRPETVSSTIRRKNKIDTLQIEINSSLFENDEDLENVVLCLDNFAKYILKILNFKTIKGNYKELTEYDNKILKREFQEKPFRLSEGKGDILISAPHSMSMVKEGKECYQETFSGAIALYLQKLFSVSTLIKTEKTDYDSDEEYVVNCEKLLSNKKHKFMIELHLMNKKRYEDIVLVCKNGKTIDGKFDYLQSFTKYIKNKYKFTIDYPFNPNNTKSPVYIVHERTGVPTLQIIINQKLIEKKKDFKKLFNVLQMIVFDLSLR